MLDFRIDTFITVCKYMNYTKAAKALHITQPAVSQHIRYIEEEYGTVLFRFQGKKLLLTDEGRLLLNAAATMKHDDRALRRLLQEEKKGRRKLVFGATLTIGEYMIGESLADYMKRYPKTQVQLTIANTEELLAGIDEGELDFALVEGFFEKSRYDFRLFKRERYIGVCAPGSLDKKGKERLALTDIFPCILISREKGSGTREMLERALDEKGYRIHDFANVIEIGNMNAIKTMVIHGGGIAFLYEAAVKKELEDGTLEEINVEGFPKYHDLTFIWRKNSLFTGKYQELFTQMTRS